MARHRRRGAAHPAVVVGVVVAAGLAVIAAASGQGLVTGWARVPEEDLPTLRNLGLVLTVAALVALAWVRGRAETSRAHPSSGHGTGEESPGMHPAEAQLAAEAHRRQEPLRKHFATAAKVAVLLVLVALLTPPPPGPDGDYGDGVSTVSQELSSERTPPLLPDRRGDGDQEVAPPGAEGEEGALALPFAGPRSRGPEDVSSSPGLPALAGDALVILLVLAGTVIAVMVAVSRLRPPPEDGEEEEEPEEDPFRMPWADAHQGLGAPPDPATRPWGTPRTPVGRAYHQLLEAMARAGAHRRLQEGPHEHLRRVAPALGMGRDALHGRDPLHRLAALHVAVEFGRLPSTADREEEADLLLREALGALEVAGKARKASDSGMPSPQTSRERARTSAPGARP